MTLAAAFFAAPVFAQSNVSLDQFHFGDDGRINCISPRQSNDRNPLPSAITGDNIARYAAELEKLLPKVADGGEFRGEVASEMGRFGLDVALLDVAIAERQHAWHNTRMEKIFQAPIDDEHVMYMIFNPTTGDLMSKSIVPIPNDNPALAFLADGDYARCAQQALLDAGFDPKGVDGAPGRGARSALTGWAAENGLTAPEWTKATSSQVCYLLTAPGSRFSELSEGMLIAYPGIGYDNWLSSSGGIHEFNGIDVKVRFDGSIKQISAIDFGPGVRYFSDADRRDELKSPFFLTGSVLTHGSDAPRTDALLALLQNDPIGQLSRHLRNVGFNPAAMPDTLLGNNDGTVYWSVVGQTDAAEVIVADFGYDGGDNRVAIIFADGEGDSSDQLLYQWFMRPVPGNEIRQ